MFIKATRHSEEFAELRNIIQKVSCFAQSQKLALELHALTHLAEISGSSTPMYEDMLWEGLGDKDFAVAPTTKSFPVAWHIWHITRIEDLVGNILIADAPQIFDAAWAKRINTVVTDTGNAMDAEEARVFSERIVVSELKQYRIAVGRRTRETIGGLTAGDIRKKPCRQSLDRLLVEGGLTDQKQSFWLRDFWGKKTFGGLVLLPLTRHSLMHLEPIEDMKKILRAGSAINTAQMLI